MSLKIIDRNIRSITTSGDKINAMIHATGVLILEHAVAHGDATRAAALLNAMPASMRRTTLKAWFEKFSPIRFAMKDGLADKVGLLKDTAKLYVPFNVEGAKAEPFYAIAKAEREAEAPKTFADVQAMVESFAKRVNKMIEDGKVEAADVPSVEAFISNVAKVKALRVEPGLPAANPRLRAAA